MNILLLFSLGVFITYLYWYYIYQKPKIKCNINSKGDRIYHIPTDRLYHAVKIDKSKGEMMVYTETEALTQGFRRSSVH